MSVTDADVANAMNGLNKALSDEGIAPKKPVITPRSKVFRTATYLEPPLAVLMDQSAKETGETNAAWLRKAAIKRLLDEKRITQEVLLQAIGA